MATIHNVHCAAQIHISAHGVAPSIWRTPYEDSAVVKFCAQFKREYTGRGDHAARFKVDVIVVVALHDCFYRAYDVDIGGRQPYITIAMWAEICHIYILKF